MGFFGYFVRGIFGGLGKSFRGFWVGFCRVSFETQFFIQKLHHFVFMAIGPKKSH